MITMTTTYGEETRVLLYSSMMGDDKPPLMTNPSKQTTIVFDHPVGQLLYDIESWHRSGRHSAFIATIMNLGNNTYKDDS